MTVTNSYDDWLQSYDEFLIRIYGMGISNNRNKYDYACLETTFWSGMLVGTDGYPTKDEDDYYCIGGG